MHPSKAEFCHAEMRGRSVWLVAQRAQTFPVLINSQYIFLNIFFSLCGMSFRQFLEALNGLFLFCFHEFQLFCWRPGPWNSSYHHSRSQFSIFITHFKSPCLLIALRYCEHYPEMSCYPSTVFCTRNDTP